MPLDFAQLHNRLVVYLLGRVHSGELTERGLARLTGVSQPHIHNVLKGKRLLSLASADSILQHLHMDILDLVDDHELRGRAGR